MRSIPLLFPLLAAHSAIATPFTPSSQHPLGSPPPGPSPKTVSLPFFASLERLARLVDITYCVGTSGISKPFSCASRCNDFPTLHLERTWNTGILLSDSCGYIAVDHGESKKTTSGGTLSYGPSIIVAFRGTYSVTNTIIDLSTVPQEYVPYPAPDDGDDSGPKCTNCTVHMGFMSSWRSAREIVIPELKAAMERHPGYPVHLIGHSLGGAVAALAGLEMKLSLGLTDMTVTTFGEPRIGNKALVNYLDAAFGLKNGTEEDREKLPYRRVTHVNDPVPLLPLTEWGFRSHAGEVYISKSDLQPGMEDLRLCHGDNDPECMGGAETEKTGWVGIPARFKLWQLFFAHRDYFWRLGLCVPGGDPSDWGRGPYNMTSNNDMGEL